MSKLVHIPETALAQLLREAGRTESVETFLATAEVQAAVRFGDRLTRRANAAYWSRFWLLFSAALSWAGLLGGPDVGGFIAAVLLTGMTVVEYRVHRLFLAADPRGAVYGWWNQCLFAFLFLVYGAYYGTFVTIPPVLNGMVDETMTATVLQAERMSYYAVGFIGACGQFWLACYYRAATR